MRGAPQKKVPLKSQSGAAVHSHQGVTARTEQRAQDPLLRQGPPPGCPQALTEHLKLPTPATVAPRHHREHRIDGLGPVRRLLGPWSPQLLHQVLNEGVLQSVGLRARLVLHTESEPEQSEAPGQARQGHSVPSQSGWESFYTALLHLTHLEELGQRLSQSVFLFLQ